MYRYPAPKYPQRKHKRLRPSRRPAPPPVAPLVLVGAELFTVDEDVRVRVSFDRAIDWTGLDAAQFTVSDGGATATAYVGTAMYDHPDPESVEVLLASTGPASGPTTLTAGAGNGITAIDNGGTWSGVTNLELPFP